MIIQSDWGTVLFLGIGLLAIFIIPEIVRRRMHFVGRA